MTFDSTVPERLLRRRQVRKGALAGALPLSVPSLAIAADEPLVVGGMPVTCTLTLPVGCFAKAAANARLGAAPASSYLYFIVRKGKQRALMPFGRPAADIAHDLALLLKP